MLVYFLLSFDRFLQEYAKQGVKIWGLTGQNEPTDGNIFHFPFQAMGWTPETQRDFIVKDLGPALEQNGFGDVKLMILDDSRAMLPYWAEKVHMILYIGIFLIQVHFGFVINEY